MATRAERAAHRAESQRIRDDFDAKEARRVARSNIVVNVADGLGKAAAAPVKAATGGKGGEALLIVGVLFLGYLFLTRRLEGVIRAISTPPGGAVVGVGASAPALTPGSKRTREPKGTVRGEREYWRDLEEWQRQHPNAPVLPDDPRSDPPGTTWRPRIRGIRI